MKSIFFLCIHLNSLFSQTTSQLDGKWCFTGLRTTVFHVRNDKLYVAMVDYSDTANFNRFMDGKLLDSMIFVEAVVLKHDDTIFISTSFPSIDHQLALYYLPSDPNNIWYTDDVYLDSTHLIVTNSNCNFDKPRCINRLYGQNDLQAITHLKNHEAFTRDDAFEFLLRLNQRFKSKCNRCYAGFTDAYMNEVLIEMGFNPIVKRTVNKSTWYNTSGFIFFIKQKFSGDEKIVKMAEFVFAAYIK